MYHSFYRSPHYYALDLNACGNIPNCIGTELMDMVGECDTLQYVREFDGVGIPIGMNEIIVDNEDPGFLVVNSGNYSHFFSKKEQNVVDKYENLKSWLIPDDRWRFFIDHNAFGKFVRSAVIRRAGKGGTHVEWNVDLKREGRYEVFVHLPKFIYSGVSTKNRNPDVTFLPFNYVISSARGEDQVVVHAKQENNWVSLGIYDYTPGHYRVKLSDKGEADYTIVAEAVKWVDVGQRETKIAREVITNTPAISLNYLKTTKNTGYSSVITILMILSPWRMASITSNPSYTCPKQVCLLSRCAVFLRLWQMKN